MDAQVSSQARHIWMDSLRGVAIVLVVVWHAARIAAGYGFETPAPLRWMNDFFLPYRMPTLMFLSGLLLAQSLSKGLRTYYFGKTRALVWPYLIWTTLLVIIDRTGEPIWDIRTWIAPGYLWYLFYVTAYYLLAPLIRPVPPWVVSIGLIAISIAMPGGDAKNFLYFGAFFFAGHAVSRHPHLIRISGKMPWLALTTGVTLTFGILSILHPDAIEYQGQYAAFSFAGIAAAVGMAQRLEGLRLMRAFAFIGKRALVYYVTHVPVILGVVALTAWLGWGHGSVFVGALVFAILASTLLAFARDHTPWRWLFTAPDLRRGS